MTTEQDLHHEIAVLRQQVAELQAQAGGPEGTPRTSEDRFRSAFDHILEGVQIIGFDWRYRYLNAAAERHNHRPSAELEGQDYRAMWPGIESTPVFAPIQRCLEERQACHLENEFTYPDGTVRWFELSIQPIPEGVFILSIDITKYKRAEAAAQESERRLSEAQRIAHMGSWEWDLRTGETHWSLENYAIHGISPNASTLTPDTLLQLIHPADQARASAVFSQAIAAGAPADLEYRVFRPDGSIRMLHAMGAVTEYDADGRPSLMVGINQDITEHKQAEEEIRLAREFLENIINLSPFAMWIADREGTVMRVNQSLCKAINLTEAEIVGKYNVFKDTNLEIQGVMPDVRAVFEQRQPARFNIPWKALNAGVPEFERARDMHIDVSIFPILDAQGELMNVVCQWVDFTEQKEAEDKLRESNQKFNAFFHNAPLQGVIYRLIRDAQGEVVDWELTDINPFGAASLGQGAPDLIGRRACEMFGMEVMAPYLEICRQVVGTEQPQIFETHFQMNDHHYLSAVFLLETDYYANLSVDITERKQAEQKLRESERQMQALVTSLDDLVFEVDEQGTYLNIWTANEAQLFQPREQVIGKRFDEIFGPDASRPFFAALERVLQSGRPETIEYSGELLEETRWFAAHYSPLIVDGQPHRSVSILVRDITESKRMEVVLRESEETLQALLNANLESVFLMDTQGTVLAANEAVAGRLGKSVHEMVGSCIWNLLPPGLTKERKARLDQVILTGKPIRFEDIRGGRNIDNYIYPVFDAEGKVVRLAVFGLDITERKHAEQELRESEARFATMFHSSPNATALTRLSDAQLIDVNRAWEALTGWPREEVLEKSPVALNLWVNPAERERLKAQMREQGRVQGFEMQMRARSGAILSLLMAAEVITLEDEPCMLSIAQDITERKKMENELRRSNAELEQFAYVASHDLQEPLRTVAGMVQLLQQRYQGQLDPRADEYIHFAVDASERMQTLINDLLNFSRIERKGRPFVATDMEKVLQAALDNLQTAITESGASITSGPLPTVQADAGQVAQVLQNLLSNAIKFRGDKPLEIHISAEKTSEVFETSEVWQFAVRDNGIGIEPQYFERVFLLFQRLHTRRKYPGTGIGLALCKKIIERHGGNMWIESELNHGATFFFTLPERAPS